MRAPHENKQYLRPSQLVPFSLFRQRLQPKTYKEKKFNLRQHHDFQPINLHLKKKKLFFNGAPLGTTPLQPLFTASYGLVEEQLSSVCVGGVIKESAGWWDDRVNLSGGIRGAP